MEQISPVKLGSLINRDSKIMIIASRFFYPDGSRLATGGGETYILNLLELFKKNKMNSVVLQKAECPFEVEFEGVKIKGWRNFREQYKLIELEYANHKSIVIYDSLHVIGKRVFNPSILIQWGISWDVYYRRFRNRFLQCLLNIKKRINTLMIAQDNLDKIKMVDKVVTVDTNFQNWMRTMCSWENFEDKFVYIPNFAEIFPETKIKEKLNRTKIETILFARRFEDFRGTFLFANVVKNLASKYPNIKFVFCGRGGKSGKEEEKLKNILHDYQNVKIYERPYSEMWKEHYDADIEVIPSYGGEGTSFSAIEAMAAGCAVVATTVGGLGNIIIPEYNGLLIQATKNDLESAIVRLIENPFLARELGRRAYDVVKGALNKERWERQILTLTNQLLEYS